MKIRIIVALSLASAAVSAQQPQPNTRDLRVDVDAPKPKNVPSGALAIPRSFALVVGIASYPNLPQNLQLHFTERDAQAIYSILISQEGGNFKAENVHRRIGSEATLANLKYELEQWLPSVAKEDDRVLIYFAGHGFLDGSGQAYLAPYNIDPKNINGTGYPMDSLAKAIGGKIRAGSKILITDACHSGAIRPEDSQNLNRAVVDLSTSLFSLTASRDREQSFESPKWGGGHGIFTYYVVKGLEGEADQNGNGLVTADELQDYVYRNVREATSGQQNPTADQGSFEKEMMLAYVPSHIKAGAPVESKYGTLVVETNMDGVEFFLDGKSQDVVNKSKPLQLKGLAPGPHTIQGVKLGYEPDGPREETVYPGQTTTVTIRILIPRRRNRAAADALDRGIESYNKGYEQNYKKAREEFQKALDLDPAYSQAALYLGRTYNALYDEANAQKYFQKAIEIDPDYLEAHSSYGAMLLDTMNMDQAVREFNIVLRREPNNVLALTNQAQAYRMKGMYAESIQSARRAAKLAPEYAEPHLWLGDSLRMNGQYDAARAEYANYLRLSNFQSKLGGQLHYYLVGSLIGMGKRKRASQQDIWKDQRNLAFFGMCDCDRKLNHFDLAIEACQKALTYDPGDPFTHYALGQAFAKQGAQVGSYEMLAAAVQHFQRTVDIAPELEQSAMAKKNIETLEKAIQSR